MIGELFSQRIGLLVLFSVVLVLGTSGIGPNVLPLQNHQREVYAQEFDEFGNPINITEFPTEETTEQPIVDEFGNPLNVTDFSTGSINGTTEQAFVDEFGNPLNNTDLAADSVNNTSGQLQLDRGMLQGLARQFGSTQIQPGDDTIITSGNDTTAEQAFVDEFGNGTGFSPSGNITDGQQQQGFVDEFGNVIPPGGEAPTESPITGQQGQSFLPAGEICDPNAETLEFMSTGPLVVRVQNLLIERGFNPGDVDGIYGANTVAAVEQFQREHQLIVDGKTGPQTWGALCNTPPIVQQPFVDDFRNVTTGNITDGQPPPPATPTDIPPSPQPFVPPTVLPPFTNIIDPDPQCTGQATPRQFQTYNKGFWNFQFGIKNQEGLVLENVLVKSVPYLTRLSVTHFKVDLPGFADPFVVRFCEGTDVHDVQPTGPNTISPFGFPGTDQIKWQFVKAIRDPINNILGTLTVDYDIIVRFDPVSVNCEFGGAPCVRLIPKVSYKWSSSIPFFNPTQVQAFYRLDFGNPEQGRGLVPFDGTPVSTGFEKFQAVEQEFLAVDRDPNDITKSVQGQVDNIHDILADSGVHVPGCRPNFFNCFHMHFRWNAPIPGVLSDDPLLGGDPLVDVMVDPTDDSKITDPPGTPYLVSGQRIDVNIVKFNNGEQAFFVPGASCGQNPCRPDADPLRLDDNLEQIAIGAPKDPSNPAKGLSNTKLGTGDHILLYYVASSLKPSDTFFRHGVYSLDTTNAKIGGFSVPNCGESPIPGPLLVPQFFRVCP